MKTFTSDIFTLNILKTSVYREKNIPIFAL